MRLSSNTEWLFFHLWKKNPETNTSCPGVKKKKKTKKNKHKNYLIIQIKK
jgi:hypothetical protein